MHARETIGVPRLGVQFQDLGRQAHAARLGMWAFLGSEVLLFAGLFALYAGYRVMYPADFAAAVGHNNAVIGTTNTLVLITSSFTVVLALTALRAARPKLAAGLLFASIAGGLVFLLLKGIEYREHFREGIFPGAGLVDTELQSHGARCFYTIYYLTTGLHAVHVTVGLVFLAAAAIGCLMGRFTAARSMPVELFALYWHLVDVIWIFLWPLLYLLHR